MGTAWGGDGLAGARVVFALSSSFDFDLPDGTRCDADLSRTEGMLGPPGPSLGGTVGSTCLEGGRGADRSDWNLAAALILLGGTGAAR